MQVIPCELSHPQKSEYGNFILQPPEGWKLRSFIDFESELLVISLSDENKNNWTRLPDGGRTIPTVQHIVDIAQRKLLSPAEWSTHFNYLPVTVTSGNGQYRLTTTRIHRPEQNTDVIEEELVNLHENFPPSTSRGMAFRDKKRENLLEAHLRRKREALERQRTIDLLPTLAELEQKTNGSLVPNELVLAYYDDTYLYRVVSSRDGFRVQRCKTVYDYQRELSTLPFSDVVQLSTLEELQAFLNIDSSWLLKNSPLYTVAKTPLSPLLKNTFYILTNGMRYAHQFSGEEYAAMLKWERPFGAIGKVKPTEIKQYCPNCKAEVRYSGRYPKYICGSCLAKGMRDDQGITLRFSNLGLGGGLRVTYLDKQGEVIREETDNSEKVCYLDGIKHLATEARFGGVVVQRIEGGRFGG